MYQIRMPMANYDEETANVVYCDGLTVSCIFLCRCFCVISKVRAAPFSAKLRLRFLNLQLTVFLFQLDHPAVQREYIDYLNLANPNRNTEPYPILFYPDNTGIEWLTVWRARTA